MAVTVASIEPADGAPWISKNYPVTARLQRADSNDYKKVETLYADFAAGTLTDVRPLSDALVLCKDDVVDDFEDDTIGQQPTGWTRFCGEDMTVQSEGGSKKVRRGGGTNLWSFLKWVAQGTAADVDLKVKWKMTQGVLTDPGITWRHTGTLVTNQYCYQVCAKGNGTQFTYYKCINGSWQGIADFSFTHIINTDYWLRVQMIGTALKVKLWIASGSEPTGWTYTTTDSSITAAGYFGVSGYTTNTMYFDLFTIINGGTTYKTSGNRVSDAYALSTVGKFSTAIVQWDATVPTNTTLVMKISKNGTAWTTVAQGDRIVLWADGDDLAAESIYMKEELATTDTAVTPTLSEVRLIFMPVDPALVEIVIDSNVGEGASCTVANGGLDYWNTVKVTAGPVIVNPCLQDVYFSTLLPWWTYAPDGVLINVVYASVTIGSATFTTECWNAWGVGPEWSYYVSTLGGVFDGPMRGDAFFEVSTVEPWLLSCDASYFIDVPPKGTFDGYWYCAHPFRASFAGSVIVGERIEQRLGGSAVVRGWQRLAHAGSVIIQGWQRTGTAGAVVVGNRLRKALAAGGFVAGQKIEQNLGGGLVVYEVNRLNAIDVQVISSDEAMAMQELGIFVDGNRFASDGVAVGLIESTEVVKS